MMRRSTTRCCALLLLVAMTTGKESKYKRVPAAAAHVGKETGTHKFKDGIEFVGKLDDNGKPVGSGVLRLPDGAKYAGQVKGGNPHGKGSLVTAEGTVYDCTWVDGKALDRCKIKWVNGDEYNGAVKDGTKHGWGYLTSESTGSKYTGFFVDGVQDGHGTYKFENGDVYSGDWKAGKPDGKGAFTWNSGIKYVGAFSNGAQHGRGVLTMLSGASRETQWVHGVVQQPTPAPTPEQVPCQDPGVPNFGRRVPDEGTAPDGSYQAGDAVIYLCNEGFTIGEGGPRRRTCGDDGKWSGKRRPTCVEAVIETLHSKNGDKYEGEIKAGKPHGRGKLTVRRMTPPQSDFGRRVPDGGTAPGGSAAEPAEKHDVYTGEFENGKPHGIGTMTTKNAQIWFGEWRHGKPYGKAYDELR